MGMVELLTLMVTHPNELKAVINYKLWVEPRDLTTDLEASRYDQPTMRQCWEMLDQTSRSFAMVIKELDGELCRVICLFYLILRGLDTVEDDMTLDVHLKEKMLLSFHEKLEQPGWKFEGSGENEKDRHLLVAFDAVIAEYQMLAPGYRTVISDITNKMGHGMAKFIRLADENDGIFSVDTFSAFDLYCHYVAGLVGEGLSRLFASSGKEAPELGQQFTLSNSMGLLLQKTNILRDFKEDVDDGRMFWPKEIWGKYATHPSELCLPENADKARWALSEMTLDALSHATDAMEYLSLLRNQTVFNFCAIPQVMAIATLEKCFGNMEVFERNVKIRRSMTVDLMSRAVNPRDLSYIFVDFALRIHARILPSDPSFVKLSVQIGQIIQWAETRYPSWITLGPNNDRVVPHYRNSPGADQITDARIKQQPLEPELAEMQMRAQFQKQQGTQKMTTEDMKFVLIVMAVVLLVIVVLSLALGLLIYMLTKEGQVKLVKFTIPIIQKRVEF